MKTVSNHLQNSLQARLCDDGSDDKQADAHCEWGQKFFYGDGRILQKKNNQSSCPAVSSEMTFLTGTWLSAVKFIKSISSVKHGIINL